MENALEQAFLSVLDEIDRGTEITRDWLVERYPEWTEKLEEALDLKTALHERRTIGPYRVMRELGRGGMGAVYLAQRGDEDPVAVKVLHRELLRRPGMLNRLLSEAEAGGDLKHDHIVPTLDVGTEVRNGRRDLYLVMEFQSGRTLRDRLATDRKLDEATCLRVATAVASALLTIHERGALHLDLKPENLIESEDGTIKVMDFGVARLAAEPALDGASGAFAGSLLYAAPEQFYVTRRELDGRADLYSLGCVLYELATGHVPTGPERPGISPTFDALVERLLIVDRERRFRSAAEVLYAIATARRDDPSHFVGREEQFVALWGLWQNAQRGRGSALLIQGDAGIGKSRLVDEICDLAATEGANVVVGSGEHPLLDGMRRAIARADLASALAEAPLLVAPFEQYWDDGEWPEQAAVDAGMVLLVRWVAARQPTIVLARDLHFGSEAARRAFISLSHAVATDAVLVLGTSRPTRLMAGVDNVVVPPLTATAMGELVARQLGTAADDVVANVMAASKGNPLVASSALRAWLQDGHLSQKERVWHLRAGDAVPRELGAIVRSRAAHLDDGQRDVLNAAACCGLSFATDVVAKVSERANTVQILQDIERDHGLLSKGSFNHDLIRGALYDAVPADRRAELHGRIGRALPQRDPERVRHLLLSGVVESALPEVRAALDMLLAQRRLDVAYELAGLALPYATGALRAEILYHYATAANSLGKIPEAETLLSEARGIREAEPATRHRVLILSAIIMSMVSRHEEARRASHEAYAIARAENDVPGQVQALWRLCDALSLTLRPKRAVVVSRRLLKLGRKHDLPMAGALESTAKAWFGGGFYREAMQHLREAIECAQLPEDTATVVLAEGHLGLAYLRQGMFADSLAHMERSRDMARRGGIRYFESMATNVLVSLYCYAGRVSDALNACRRQLQLGIEVGSAEGEVRAQMSLGQVGLLLGDDELFHSSMDAARIRARDLTVFRFELDSKMIDAVWQARWGDRRRALELAHEIIEGGTATDYWLIVCHAHALSARAYFELGDHENAMLACDRGDEIAQRVGCIDVLAQSACLRARMSSDAAAALVKFAELKSRCVNEILIECEYDLWKVTDDDAHLLEARRLVHAYLLYAPAESRERMASYRGWAEVLADSEQRFGEEPPLTG